MSTNKIIYNVCNHLMPMYIYYHLLLYLFIETLSLSTNLIIKRFILLIYSLLRDNNTYLLF